MKSENRTDLRQEHVLIVGTGAMALLFGARLAASGCPVTLLGTWPEGLDALRRFGVRLVETDGSVKSFPVHAAGSPQDCPTARQALVLVKSWQTHRAGLQLRDCLQADGLALTLQNGLGNREVLTDALGAQRVALGVTTQGATLSGPGQVRPAGVAHISLLQHPRLAPLAARLAAAGFAIETATDADALLWAKLIINAAINPLTALLGVPNGELLKRPAARQLRGQPPRRQRRLPQHCRSACPLPMRRRPLRLWHDTPPRTVLRCSRTCSAVFPRKLMRSVAPLSNAANPWEYPRQSTIPCCSWCALQPNTEA